MIYFAASTFIVVWRQDTDRLTSELKKFNIDNPNENFIPGEAGFNFGFGFLQKLPPDYGELKFELVTTKGP